MLLEKADKALPRDGSLPDRTTVSSSSMSSSPPQPGAAPNTLGGPWDEYALCASDAMLKLRLQCAPKTPAHAAQWAAHHREIESVDQVVELQVVDVYTSLIALALAPVALVVYSLLVVASLPGFVVAGVYMKQLTHPLTNLERDSNFQVIASILWILALPSQCLIVVHWLLVLPFILASSVVYSLLSLKIRHFRYNAFILRGCSHWPKWRWRDTVCGLLGAIHRVGWWRFVLQFPTCVVVVPVVKYLFGANPFLYKLSIRHCNQWTSSLDLEDADAVAAVVQSASWTFLQDNKQPSDRHPALTTTFATTGHIQMPPPNRVVPMVFGVHVTNSLVAFSNTEHNVSGNVFHSKLARRGIYNVMLYAWNPCHYLTGYIEVNLRHDGAIEQPSACCGVCFFAWGESNSSTNAHVCFAPCFAATVWCITGDNYIGNQLFQRAEALLWHFVPPPAHTSLASSPSLEVLAASSTSSKPIDLVAAHSIITMDSNSDLIVAI